MKKLVSILMVCIMTVLLLPTTALAVVQPDMYLYVTGNIREVEIRHQQVESAAFDAVETWKSMRDSELSILETSSLPKWEKYATNPAYNEWNKKILKQLSEAKYTRAHLKLSSWIIISKMIMTVCSESQEVADEFFGYITQSNMVDMYNGLSIGNTAELCDKLINAIKACEIEIDGDVLKTILKNIKIPMQILNKDYANAAGGVVKLISKPVVQMGLLDYMDQDAIRAIGLDPYEVSVDFSSIIGGFPDIYLNIFYKYCAAKPIEKVCETFEAAELNMLAEAQQVQAVRQAVCASSVLPEYTNRLLGARVNSVTREEFMKLLEEETKTLNVQLRAINEAQTIEGVMDALTIDCEISPEVLELAPNDKFIVTEDVTVGESDAACNVVVRDSNNNDCTHCFDIGLYNDNSVQITPKSDSVSEDTVYTVIYRDKNSGKQYYNEVKYTQTATLGNDTGMKSVTYVSINGESITIDTQGMAELEGIDDMASVEAVVLCDENASYVTSADCYGNIDIIVTAENGVTQSCYKIKKENSVAKADTAVYNVIITPEHTYRSLIECNDVTNPESLYAAIYYDGRLEQVVPFTEAGECCYAGISNMPELEVKLLYIEGTALKPLANAYSISAN